MTERISGWRRAALMMGVAGLGWASATAGLPGSPASAQVPPPASARAPVQAADDGRLHRAQLEQLLAPVALYPDQLLAQMLMAATYPLEVVQAQRWLQQGQNAQLRGDALAQVLVAQPWDPSVKSLLPFPDVLKMMNDQLEWTQQVGDALLAQQEDVLNAVQILRGRAQAAGMLQSGPQQTVTVNTNVTVPQPGAGASAPAVAPPPQVIVIEPTQPDTVYVPAYDPNIAYGSWPYPSYPPPYYPPPASWGIGNALLTGMAFAGGVALVGSLWGWASPGWGGGSVSINTNRYNSINVNRSQISGNNWRHDSSHRQGVAYRNTEVRDRYRSDSSGGAAARDRTQSRDQFRGRVDQVDLGGPANRSGAGVRVPTSGAQRPDAGDSPPGSGNRGLADSVQRPAAGTRGSAGTAQRSTTQAASGRPQVQQRAAQPQRSPQAFQGVGNGGFERAAAQRGASSRQAPAAPRAAAPRGGSGAHAGRSGGGGRR